LVYLALAEGVLVLWKYDSLIQLHTSSSSGLSVFSCTFESTCEEGLSRVARVGAKLTGECVADVPASVTTVFRQWLMSWLFIMGVNLRADVHYIMGGLNCDLKPGSVQALPSAASLSEDNGVTGGFYYTVYVRSATLVLHAKHSWQRYASASCFVFLLLISRFSFPPTHSFSVWYSHLASAWIAPLRLPIALVVWRQFFLPHNAHCDASCPLHLEVTWFHFFWKDFQPPHNTKHLKHTLCIFIPLKSLATTLETKYSYLVYQWSQKYFLHIPKICLQMLKFVHQVLCGCKAHQCWGKSKLKSAT
jgi:hypothetical protein